MTTVDLTPLTNATARLAEALALYQRDIANAIVRDALIKRFEFTYDLAPKALRRMLASRSDTPSDIDAMSFPALMRTAFEQGLMDATWPRWLDYREKRNITSHTYDEAKALTVVARIPEFLEEVRSLAARLAAAIGT